MKKLMLAIASAVAIGFSASAVDSTWFNGGIGSAFPNDTSMSGGAWSNTTDQAEWNATTSAVDISADATNPVTFVATEAKQLGVNVQTLTCNATTTFEPFTNMTGVATDGKAGIAVVSNETEYAFYVLQRDSASSTNMWVKTSVEGPAYGTAVAVSVKVEALENKSLAKATYTLNGSTYVAEHVQVSNTAFDQVGFFGDAGLKALTGAYDTSVTLKLPTTLPSTYSGDVIVSNLTDGLAVTASEGVYTVDLGDAVGVYYKAANGYFFDGQLWKQIYYYESMSGNVDLSDETPSKEPAAAPAKIGDVYYTSLEAAVAAAQNNDLVELCTAWNLSAELDITKPLTIDLCENGLTLTNVQKGIVITADNVVISNGTINGGLGENWLKSKAIEVAHANVTLEALDISAAYYEYAIYANCDAIYESEWGKDLSKFYDQTDAEMKTLTCTDVYVYGNGSLFHVEGMKATLDEDCEALGEISETYPAFADTAHRAAIYGAVNAKVTVNGGSYSHVNALQTGNLGGTITVNDGTFNGNLMSFMYEGDDRGITGNKGYMNLAGGTYETGTIAYGTGMPGTCSKEAAIEWNLTGGSYNFDPTKVGSDEVDYLGSGYTAVENAETGYYDVVAAYRVTIMDGITGGDVEVNKTKAAAGETVTITVTPNAGYTISEVTVDGTKYTPVEGVCSFTMPANNVVVGATFNAETYTINYDLAGGVVATANPATYTVETATFTLTNPTKTGCTFAGWTGTGLTEATNEVMIAKGSTGNRSYTATWATQQYTVTFTTNKVNHSSIKVDYNATLSNSQIPVITEAGAWDIPTPTNAVITCDTNFNYTVAAAGPTSEDGKMSDPDPSTGIITFTPDDASAAEVTITLNDSTARISVPGTIGSIKGVPSNQLIITLNGCTVDNNAFVGGDETGFSTALSATGYAEVQGKTIPVQPTIGETIDGITIETPFDGNTGAATIATIPGLYYQLKRGTEPSTSIATSGTAASVATKAEDKTLTLTDSSKPDGKAFYMINVTKTAE